MELTTHHGSSVPEVTAIFVKWSIFAIRFDSYWHDQGMIERFCNEKV